MIDNGNIRKFDTGATRDTSVSKNYYCSVNSPLVEKAFGDYMTKHRVQSDGSLRDPDNWKKLFGDNHVRECLESLMRHVHDIWMEVEGYESRDGLDEAIGGARFNIDAIWHKIELDKRK